MKKLFFYAIFLIMPIAAFAHGHEEHLGHHWEETAYISEVHFQIIFIGALLTLAVALSYFTRRYRSRSIGR